MKPDLGVRVRTMSHRDWAQVTQIYGEGIATGDATFDHDVPDAEDLDRRWLPNHRWVAVVGGVVAGWAAASRFSTRPCYSGVADTSVRVAEAFRGRGIGRALVGWQAAAADRDDDLWTLQTSVFPENHASLALHRSAGFRVVGRREKIGRQAGRWRDTILLERRSPGASVVGRSDLADGVADAVHPHGVGRARNSGR